MRQFIQYVKRNKNKEVKEYNVTVTFLENGHDVTAYFIFSHGWNVRVNLNL